MYPLVLCDLDIMQAFDYMNHIKIDDMNQERYLDTNSRLVAVQDYTGKEARANMNGVGS